MSPTPARKTPALTSEIPPRLLDAAFAILWHTTLHADVAVLAPLGAPAVLHLQAPAFGEQPGSKVLTHSQTIFLKKKAEKLVDLVGNCSKPVDGVGISLSFCHPSSW